MLILPVGLSQQEKKNTSRARDWVERNKFVCFHRIPNDLKKRLFTSGDSICIKSFLTRERENRLKKHEHTFERCCLFRIFFFLFFSSKYTGPMQRNTTIYFLFLGIKHIVVKIRPVQNTLVTFLLNTISLDQLQCTLCWSIASIAN